VCSSDLLQQKDGGHQMHIKTMQMEGKSGFEYSNTDTIIPIDEEYYNQIYEKIVNINFREIILANQSVFGADGEYVKIEIGTTSSNLILGIWSPSLNMLNRKTEGINAILQDLFAKAGLEEWY
jgi:hypothetical protein